MANQNGVSRSIIHNDFTNVAPRLGFAYDLKGDGREVLRGGYGIFYFPDYGGISNQLGQQAPVWRLALLQRPERGTALPSPDRLQLRAAPTAATALPSRQQRCPRPATPTSMQPRPRPASARWPSTAMRRTSRSRNSTFNWISRSASTTCSTCPTSGANRITCRPTTTTTSTSSVPDYRTSPTFGGITYTTTTAMPTTTGCSFTTSTARGMICCHGVLFVLTYSRRFSGIEPRFHLGSLLQSRCRLRQLATGSAPRLQLLHRLSAAVRQRQALWR